MSEILERLRTGTRVTKADIDAGMRQLVEGLQIRKALTRHDALHELTAADTQVEGWATESERASYREMYAAYVIAPPDLPADVAKTGAELQRERSAGFAAERAFEERVQKLLRVKKWLSYSAAFTEICREPEGSALYAALCDAAAWQMEASPYIGKIAKSSQQAALDLRRGLGR